MKILAAGAVVVLLSSGIAIAQVQAQGGKPDASPTPALKLVSGNEEKHARNADARHCLDLKTDLEIYRCAEKYR